MLAFRLLRLQNRREHLADLPFVLVSRLVDESN